ncbi:MAG: pentapeptide repeat-containing protein [Methanothrix sp.]
MVFLLLAVMALEAAGALGTSDQPMREVDAGEILAKVEAGQPVEYDHVVVRGDLDLSRERLHRNITSPIKINDSIFEGKVDFNDSVIKIPVDLSGSNFARDAYFVGTAFSDDARFSWAAFSRNAYFEGTAFSSDTYFVGSAFSDDAHFREATFSCNASFLLAAFSGDAYLWEVTFNGDANFLLAAFSDSAYFDETEFSSDANFWGATFSGDADFEEAVFSGNAYFERATFSGDASFLWAVFSGNADFEEAEFSGDADFMGADLIGNSSFEDAEFNANIEFGDARFENETSFYRILFKRPAYFEDCSINSLDLTKAEYSRLHLRWGDIKSLHFDEAAYLALIKNYNTLGWYGDANRCYYDYRNAVRKNWQAPSSGLAARISNLLDRLIDFGEWLLYGYGVRPSFPIAWSIAIILAFGLFFRQKRCLRKIITEEKIEDSEDGSDEVLVESKARKAPLNFIDPFLFSLFTFTSGFTAFLHPAVEYKLERCLRWAIAERLLGPFLLALVITTISKTYLIR